MTIYGFRAKYLGGERKKRDRQRDWILRRAGWTVKRFYGTTIHRKVNNCAFVVKKEMKARRDWVIAQAREKERRRHARREAILRPFMKIARFFKRSKNRR